jgi:magnesium chelatase family protein
MKIGSSTSIGLIGLRSFCIQVQAFISAGLPSFSIIGLPDTSLGEARERVKAACISTGFRWPDSRITVNLSPASLPKRGSSHDLAIAIGILCAAGVIEPEACNGSVMVGELNLDGTVLPITGILPILLFAQSIGVSKVYVPAANLDEAKLVPDVDVIPIRHLSEAVDLLGGRFVGKYRGKVARQNHNQPPKQKPSPPNPQRCDSHNDMNEIIGQENAKHALEVAAAGGHHILMSGPPGAGKTMLAERIPTILPNLTDSEALEVASIRSLTGTLTQYGISKTPPFEAPHHTATSAALAGGGAAVAQPGAISRAHRGVLFLDEAPEFSTRALQTLREPLETGVITLSRAKSVTQYPARFLLVMAANPCPCGFGWGKGDKCTCSQKDRTRYWSRLSGPLLDRIDIQITVPPVASLNISARPCDSSATIRERVVLARATARERYKKYGWTCNGQAHGQWLRENTSMNALDPLTKALQKDQISLRGVDRTIRLAWTLADLEGVNAPSRSHIEEALFMRTRVA